MRGTGAAVLGKVREYRWELWLFFGVPVIASAVAWGTAYEAQSSDSTGFRYTVRFLSGYIAWLVLLGDIVSVGEPLGARPAQACVAILVSSRALEHSPHADVSLDIRKRI